MESRRVKKRLRIRDGIYGGGEADAQPQTAVTEAKQTCHPWMRAPKPCSRRTAAPSEQGKWIAYEDFLCCITEMAQYRCWEGTCLSNFGRVVEIKYMSPNFWENQSLL